MVGVKRDHDSPPAPVAKSWRQIEAWLDGHLPAVRVSLRPGVSKRDLNRFEKALGRALPDDVRDQCPHVVGQLLGRVCDRQLAGPLGRPRDLQGTTPVPHRDLHRP